MSERPSNLLEAGAFLARFAVQRGPGDGQVRNTLHHALRQVDSNGVTWQSSEPQSQLNAVIDVSILRVCRMAT